MSKEQARAELAKRTAVDRNVIVEGRGHNQPALADTYRMVDFVKAVAMRDERGMEVRVNRIRLGASVDRESTEKVASIVLNGTWFDITTQDDSKTRDARAYRVHVTNVVSAER